MWLLAGLASLVFPGTGQALTGKWRPAAAWAAIGLVPIALMLIWIPMVHAIWVVRIAAAIDAGWRIRRDRPARPDLGLAGGVALSTGVILFAVKAFVFEAFALPASSMTPTLQIGDHFFVNKQRAAERGDVVVFWHPAGLTYVKRLIAIGGDTVAVRRGVVHVNGVAVPRRELGTDEYVDHDLASGESTRKHVVAYEETLGGHSYRVFLAPPRPDGGAEGLFRDFPQTSDAYFTAEGDPCARRPMMAETDVADTRPQMTLTADGTACTVPAGHLFLLGDNRDNSNDSRSWGVVSRRKLVGVVAGIWWPAARMGRVD